MEVVQLPVQNVHFKESLKCSEEGPVIQGLHLRATCLLYFYLIQSTVIIEEGTSIEKIYS